MQHLDEGTIHAWLDGELPADEAEKIAAHANECAECGALVAEARGLIAASTRILTALDNVPAGVMPSGLAPPEKPAVAGGPPFRRHWYDRTDVRAAAAVLFVAGASLVAVRATRNPAQSLKAVATTASSAADMAPVLMDTAAPATSAAQTEIAPQERRSEAKSLAAKPGAFADQMRRERQVAASPPALSKKAATRETFAAPAPAMANAMDAVAQSSPQGKVRSDAPVPGRVQGQVTDRAKGTGVPAANVIVEGTRLAATTDEEGRFTIDSVPAGDRRLLVRRIGYLAQTVPLAVKEESGATATVALAPSSAELNMAVVTGIAAGSAAATGSAVPLRVVKADSTASSKRVVYQVSPGVEVTLVESPISVAEKDLIADEKAKDKSSDRAAAAPAPRVMRAMAAPPPINTISWSDQNRRYTLSGPLKPAELEAIKARLMKMRR